MDRSLDRRLGQRAANPPSELTRLPIPAPANGHTDSTIEVVRLTLDAVDTDRPGGLIMPVEVGTALPGLSLLALAAGAGFETATSWVMRRMGTVPSAPGTVRSELRSPSGHAELPSTGTAATSRRSHVADPQVAADIWDRDHYESDHANNDDHCQDCCDVTNDVHVSSSIFSGSTPRQRRGDHP
jgi:hypothetical protein